MAPNSDEKKSNDETDTPSFLRHPTPDRPHPPRGRVAELIAQFECLSAGLSASNMADQTSPARADPVSPAPVSTSETFGLEELNAITRAARDRGPDESIPLPPHLQVRPPGIPEAEFAHAQRLARALLELRFASGLGPPVFPPPQGDNNSPTFEQAAAGEYVRDSSDSEVEEDNSRVMRGINSDTNDQEGRELDELPSSAGLNNSQPGTALETDGSLSPRQPIPPESLSRPFLRTSGTPTGLSTTAAHFMAEPKRKTSRPDPSQVALGSKFSPYSSDDFDDTEQQNRLDQLPAHLRAALPSFGKRYATRSVRAAKPPPTLDLSDISNLARNSSRRTQQSERPSSRASSQTEPPKQDNKGKISIISTAPLEDPFLADNGTTNRASIPPLFGPKKPIPSPNSGTTQPSTISLAPKSPAEMEAILRALIPRLKNSSHLNKSWSLPSLLALIEKVILGRCNEGLKGEKLWDWVEQEVVKETPRRKREGMKMKWWKVREFVGFEERVEGEEEVEEMGESDGEYGRGTEEMWRKYLAGEIKWEDL